MDIEQIFARRDARRANIRRYLTDEQRSMAENSPKDRCFGLVSTPSKNTATFCQECKGGRKWNAGSFAVSFCADRRKIPSADRTHHGLPWQICAPLSIYNGWAKAPYLSHRLCGKITLSIYSKFCYNPAHG